LGYPQLPGRTLCELQVGNVWTGRSRRWRRPATRVGLRGRLSPPRVVAVLRTSVASTAMAQWRLRDRRA